MEQFLNPRSMITPGIAGGMIMLLANSVCFVFPDIPFRYVAFALSFLIGFGTVAAGGEHLAKKAVYWVANSLIIFSMGIGASNIGANIVEESGKPARAVQAEAAGGKSAWSFLIVEAYAQDNGGSSGNADKQKFFRRW